MIDKLTPEQESLISVYRDKWFKIALSTERVDRQKAAAAIKASYQQYYSPNYVEPEIIFFQSPNQAFAKLSDSGVWDMDFELDISNINCFQNLEEDLWRQIQSQIETTLLEFTLLNPIKEYIYSQIVDIGLIYYERQQFATSLPREKKRGFFILKNMLVMQVYMIFVFPF